ncbi:hypothetical protein MBLNU230_g6028t1 [Neophaeotheca triangularis]
MSGFKVVALISGGKDSLFSILHCIENGHDVVALANLFPRAQEGVEAAEDTDSFMYQTIGHAIIPLYEEALGLPLFRQEIHGAAVNQSKDYDPVGSEDLDETESLVPLLKKAMTALPEVNAVSTGAILSDYQRTRVESVALRLGLTPLSYLWQYPTLPPGTQDSLLRDMSAAGQDSRIIKVASGGLDESFLWRNVADPRIIHRLNQATKRFGSTGDGAVLGEGGEFETLAVDGPAPLWKRRIDVSDEDWQAVNGDAGTAFARISGARCVEKDVADATTPVRRPSLLDSRSAALYEKCKNGALTHLVPDAADTRGQHRGSNTMSSKGAIHLPNITGNGSTAAQQTEFIMNRVCEQLSKHGHQSNDICYTSITLREMGDFAAVNPVYGRYFTAPNPPARVTIACADVLPQDSFLSVSTTSVPRPSAGQRSGLHVQSRSYWAPANIGPYSQAIVTPLTNGTANDAPNLIYIAGQIPLMPASMELPILHEAGSKKDSFLFQGVLSLQHLTRIGLAMKVKVWLHAIAFVTATSRHQAQSRATQAKRLWAAAHAPDEVDSDEGDSADNFDVWDLKHGMHSHNHSSSPDSREILQAPSLAVNCTLSVIWVDQLPRRASIEWASYGCTSIVEADDVELPHFDSMVAVFSERLVG